MAIVNIKAQVDEAVREYMYDTSHAVRDIIKEKTDQIIVDFYKEYKKPKRHIRGDRLKKLLRIRIDSHHKRQRDIILDADAYRLGNDYPKWVTNRHIYEWSFVKGGHGWLYNSSWVAPNSGTQVFFNSRRGIRNKSHRFNRDNSLRIIGAIPKPRIDFLLGAPKTGRGSGPAAPNSLKRQIENEVINPALERLGNKLEIIVEDLFNKIIPWSD